MWENTSQGNTIVIAYIAIATFFVYNDLNCIEELK